MKILGIVKKNIKELKLLFIFVLEKFKIVSSAYILEIPSGIFCKPKN